MTDGMFWFGGHKCREEQGIHMTLATPKVTPLSANTVNPVRNQTQEEHRKEALILPEGSAAKPTPSGTHWRGRDRLPLAPPSRLPWEVGEPNAKPRNPGSVSQ